VVRPEKLTVSLPENAPGDQPGVDGIVESSLYLGTSTQMAIRVADDVQMTVLVPNASEDARQHLPGGGARVRLNWLPEHMHLVAESEADQAADDQTPTETVTEGVS
jgi:hypothetical protein